MAARARDRRRSARCSRARSRPAGACSGFFGVSESAVARALAEAGGDGDGVEATICARDFEIHVDLVVEPGAEARADALETALLAPLERWLFARDERPIEEHVLELCRARGLHARDGGVVHGRARRRAPHLGTGLERRRSLGGVVAYANEVKQAELGVADELLARARRRLGRGGGGDGARARGPARRRRRRAVTGIAGPGGGTPEKPVGLVYLHAEGPDGELGREFSFPGDRASIRARSVVMALHLVRTLLTRSPDEGV